MSDAGVIYDSGAVHGLEAFEKLKKKMLFDESALSPRQKDLIAAVVSRINGSKMCTVGHAMFAARRSEDPALYEALIRDYREADVGPEDGAMLEYVAKLTSHPAQIGAEDIAALKSHGFDDAAIGEMILVAAIMGVENRLRLGMLSEMPPRVRQEAARLGM